LLNDNVETVSANPKNYFHSAFSSIKQILRFCTHRQPE